MIILCVENSAQKDNQNTSHRETQQLLQNCHTILRNADLSPTSLLLWNYHIKCIKNQVTVMKSIHLKYFPMRLMCEVIQCTCILPFKSSQPHIIALIDRWIIEYLNMNFKPVCCFQGGLIMAVVRHWSGFFFLQKNPPQIT